MSELGTSSIDFSRLETLSLDPVVQAVWRCIQASSYLWTAAKRLLEMLGNIDVALQLKHLIRILLVT